MGKIVLDKKMVAIIVISSLLFVVSILAVVFSVLFINETKNRFYQLQIEDIVLKHDFEKECGMIEKIISNKTKIILPSTYSIVDGEIVEGNEFSIVGIADNTFNKSLITHIEIPASITYIGECAFYECLNLESVEASNLVTVDEFAFYGCKNLTNFEVCSYEKIMLSKYALAGCESLEDFGFINFVSDIGECAFYKTGAESVSLPATIESIGNEAFSNCDKLKVVYLPNSLECNVGKDLFVGTRLQKLVARGNLSLQPVINSNDENLNFNTIEIYENEETIKAGCFSGFKSVEKVVLPKAISQIQNLSFDNVERIGSLITPAVYDMSYDFEGLSQVDNLIIIPSNISNEVCGHYAAVCNTKINNIIIREGVKVLGENCFSGIDSVNVVSLPSTLVSVSESSFAGCKIKRVEILSGELDCLSNIESDKVEGYYVNNNLLTKYKGKYTAFADKFFDLFIEK